MQNVIALVGRLTRDPETRYAGENPVAHFTIAVDRAFARDGQQKTDFIDIVAFRKLAEQIGKYATKGRLVAVEGRLQIRSYEAKDGSGKRRVAEVVANGVRFLDKPKDSRGDSDRRDADVNGAPVDDEPHVGPEDAEIPL